MARIGKLGMRFKGKYMEWPIFYTQKMKFYISGLPQDLLNVVHTKTSGYETELELSNSITTAFATYHVMITTEKKYIAYKINASSDMIQNVVRADTGGKTISGHKPGISEKITPFDFHSGIGFKDGSAIAIEHIIVIEIDNNGKKFYRVNEKGDKTHSTDVDKYQLLEYTPEREAFFNSLHGQMMKLLEKMSTFFGRDDLVNAIDKIGGESIKFLTDGVI